MVHTDPIYGYNTGSTLQSYRSLRMSTICFIYTLVQNKGNVSEDVGHEWFRQTAFRHMEMRRYNSFRADVHWENRANICVINLENAMIR